MSCRGRRKVKESFEAFVTARGPRLFGTAVLLTQDRGLAEDLVQTSLLKTWRHWSRIEGPPEAYVRTTMVNTYVSWWRRKWRGELPTEALPDSPDRSPAGDVETREDLRVALARLPRRQRAVVVLRFYEDLPVHEVARLLDCSEGTVKSQTSKALAKLGADDALEEHRTARAEEATR